jgi:hypothetical protein
VTLAALVLVPIAPLFISFYFMRLDARGRAFIDTANTGLLLIETSGSSCIRTIIFRRINTSSQCFPVAVTRSSTNILTCEISTTIPTKTLVQSTSAHASEAAILRLFWWLWIILFTTMVIHFAWHLANPAWRPT